ncbi:SEC10/PgrA surface exclusion domain-containing protein [Streptococcus suis]|uniref:SEC10/PgrA surface exclusion domain-containing protein n=1 Tax=Streptococcus suis TaxID=1307 RepID=UPI001ABDC0BE|nr:SEC10/PgrA surface exclusion domain-containing protein [Streptococcus suis]
MTKETVTDYQLAEELVSTGIQLPEGFAAALAEYIRDGKSGLDSTLEKLGELGLEANRFQGNEADKSRLIADIEVVDQEILEELALYATDLLNPLREALGSVAVEVSSLALDYAKSLAASIEAGLYKHDYDSLIEIAKQKGVEPQGKDCIAFSEYREGGYSLNDAKELIYQGLVWRLFDDSHADYGHAAILLGIEQEDSGVEAIGFAFSRLSLHVEWLLTHMIFIPKDWVLNQTN